MEGSTDRGRPAGLPKVRADHQARQRGRLKTTTTRPPPSHAHTIDYSRPRCRQTSDVLLAPVYTDDDRTSDSPHSRRPVCPPSERRSIRREIRARLSISSCRKLTPLPPSSAASHEGSPLPPGRPGLGTAHVHCQANSCMFASPCSK